MFLKRYYTPEMMDDFSIEDERIDIALKELNVINLYLGGNSTSIEGLKKIMKRTLNKEELRILDVGSGGTNLFYRFKTNSRVRLRTIGVDLNLRTCKFSKKEYDNYEIVCSNALILPIKSRSVDIVHVSLFLHHFKEDEIKLLLNSFLSISNFGIVINDLQRSVFAFTGIKILTMLFSKSEFVKNDGPLSVLRGFRKAELLSILSKTDASGFEIKWRWAFRWLVIIYK